MSRQTSSRYGKDGPSTILLAADVPLTEASEEMPQEVPYSTGAGFLPAELVAAGGDVSGLSLTSGTDDWKQYPGKLDLHWWEGDDVIITLNVTDPNNPALDLSAATGGCAWKASVRGYHDRGAPFLYNFSISSTFTPPAGEDDGVTEVKMFLPRSVNTYQGAFSWDLQVTIPDDLSEFPKPVDVADEDWPPADRVMTFLQGLVYVVPEVTRDDITPVGPGAVVNVWWPNGRVP